MQLSNTSKLYLPMKLQARGSKRQSRGKIDAPSRKAQKASEMNASPIRAEEPCTAEEEEEETTISDKQAEVHLLLRAIRTL